jgi:hypothetical protein
MAEGRTAPLGPTVSGCIGFDRELGRGSRGAERPLFGLTSSLAQLLLEAGVLFPQKINLALLL